MCGPDAGMWEQHDWPLIEALVTGVRHDPPTERLRFDTAGRRAKARNLLQGDDQGELDLWDTKWIPEGHHYERLERPRQRADLVLTPTR